MFNTIRNQIAYAFYAVGDLFNPEPPGIADLDGRSALRPGETIGEFVGRLNEGRVA